MKDLIKKKCALHGIPVEILTDGELRKLRKEIEAEQNGEMVLDGVLNNENIVFRALDARVNPTTRNPHLQQPNKN